MQDFGIALDRLEKHVHEDMTKHHGLDKMRKAVAVERVKKIKKEGSHSVNIDPVLHLFCFYK